DAGDREDRATVTAKHTAGGCAVEVAGGGGALAGGGTMSARPLVIDVDAHCLVTEDPEGAARSAADTHALGTHAPATRRERPGDVRAPRSGCCGAQAAPASSFAMAFVVLAALLRRPRRR
ncbi:MAG TPA: hypothetical protein VLT45_17845, partial [Kofleriaceae bacterium]|nr:hypothetical protein [Kofleriaceae bacterium]